jgi:KaiC/GvpD/RAD55 family RecA-like ATPase
MMRDFMEVSPLRILEKSSRKELDRGNLGVLIARAGVGKTACLIHFAIDKLFREEKLVHLCLEDIPEKVIAHYNVIFSDLVSRLSIPNEDEIRMRIGKNRVILAYLNQSFEINRLRANLRNLTERVVFRPDTIVVDGLNFEKAERDLIKSLKEVAEEFQVEIWFSALSHRHITEANERGIPYPCHNLDDLFSVIIHLEALPSGLFLKLLKDHDNPTIRDISIKLDPNTLLAVEES